MSDPSRPKTEQDPDTPSKPSPSHSQSQSSKPPPYLNNPDPDQDPESDQGGGVEVDDDEDDDDDQTGDAEGAGMLTMAASVVLGNLPRDAEAALREAVEKDGGVGRGKVQIRIHPISSAPHLTQRVFKISPTSPFSSIHRFLRRKLGLKQHEALHCYIGNVFAPGLDEEVGGLWRCFKTGEELVVGYAVVEAFG